MRIFLLIFLCLVISSCKTGSDLRADLNLYSLTVDSEEEFRNLELLKEFKSNSDVKKHKFTVNVPIQTVAKRFIHCGTLENKNLPLVKEITAITNHKNTYIKTFWSMFEGYTINEIWELHAVSDKVTQLEIYWDGMVIESVKSKTKRYENRAKGISDEDSITYVACKF